MNVDKLSGGELKHHRSLLHFVRYLWPIFMVKTSAANIVKNILTCPYDDLQKSKRTMSDGENYFGKVESSRTK